MKVAVAFGLVFLLAPSLCRAQTAAGTVAGVVRGPSDVVPSGARVQAVSRATGEVRWTLTTERGEYSLPALVPGDYDVSVTIEHFPRAVRTASVAAGTTTTVNLAVLVGRQTDSITVDAAAPRLRYDSAAVAGVISRDLLEAVPLNGRGFLELAKLEPGVQAAGPTNRNRSIVPVLAAPAANVGGPRFIVDGGSVTSVGLGGSQMGFSQEVVQEFQLSTVTFDPSAGLTAAGAVNVVSRAGSNELSGHAFYYLRDQRLAAYPALNRDAQALSPTFKRQHGGATMGGPVRRSRVFAFGSWERQDQHAVAETTLLSPDVAHLTRVTETPAVADLVSVRLDMNVTQAHRAFARYSHDGNRTFGPGAAVGPPNAYPSSWSRASTRAQQGLLGLTSMVRPTLVNDLRVSWFGVRSTIGPATASECSSCLGLGAPAIAIPNAGLFVGHSTRVDYRGRRVHLNESLTWQRTAHRWRFGVDWERNGDRNALWRNDPVAMTLYSPDEVRAYNARPGLPPEQRLPLPASISTVDDLLQLPLHSFTVGVGDPGVPREDGGPVRRWHTLWLYADDTWRASDSLTLTYGLGWGLDTVLNDDLRKPALLAPLLGTDQLGPTRRVWTNFSPVLGVAWTPSADRRTVVRAGAGRYYAPHGLTSSMDAERVALGPPGLRQDFAGAGLVNPIPGVPGVPVGRSLDFRGAPTRFAGMHLLSILPSIREVLAKRLSTADRTHQQIQVTKQHASPAIFPAQVDNPSAIHLNLGVQRELTPRLVLGADIVYRRFADVPLGGGSLDLNRFNSARGPLVPVCEPAQRDTPDAICSLGPINVYVAPFSTTYKGVLLRADGRVTNRVRVLGSYAFSSNTGTNIGNGFDLEHWLANTGPTPADFTHVLNVAGAGSLPWRLEVGFNFSYVSAPPFSAYLGRIDLNGDGTQGDLLPGTIANGVNRGLGRAALERLVTDFNRTRTGTGSGFFVPTLTLPGSYAFGDDAHGLDLRLSRSFQPRAGLRLLLIAELFNAYNAANLSGYSGDLLSPAFGQPTSRATQVFGSSGPRALQLASRISF